MSLPSMFSDLHEAKVCNHQSIPSTKYILECTFNKLIHEVLSIFPVLLHEVLYIELVTELLVR